MIILHRFDDKMINDQGYTVECKKKFPDNHPVQKKIKRIQQQKKERAMAHEYMGQDYMGKYAILLLNLILNYESCRLSTEILKLSAECRACIPRITSPF